VLEEIQHAGCNGGACHAQMYIMGTFAAAWRPIAEDALSPRHRLGRAPAAGLRRDRAGQRHRHDSIRTFARRDGDHYVVNGQKVWTSRAEHSDLMLLLARTTSRDQVAKRTDGLSVFILEMRQAGTEGLTIRPIRTMMNHSTTEVFFDNVRVPAENLVGEEGKGFRYILSGMNAERILIAAECVATPNG